ncbi:MAG: glycosyltransferase family 4 protein [Melioribacteraceae bacterium]|nr:glycosyltransferase family 4 protein [Melioribacteraceae bacterium]MCF8355567.1 glycosyltransferase family 4 protein [Melioribacteraceae bacterium]MCF8394242.1 glycosyltransferase family 4 protein [Melioribacteraceae bacterium]MCF8419963.1 glycosyltransferase family 4 protein [Melioribacteraceae bacterium]
MKKVLIITYYWPPAGGPGVQRVLKFVKYLPQFGWEPVILTVENGEYPAIDKSLLNEIPDGLKVYKTKTFEPFLLYKGLTGHKGNIPTHVLSKSSSESFIQKASKWARANIFIPDARAGWISSIVKNGLEIIEKEKPDIILSSSPPHSLQIGAMKLAEKSRLKWIADLRDPWTDGFWQKDLPRTNYAIKKDKSYEHEVLTRADGVVAVSKSIIELLSRKVKNNYHIIPNGYDENDFKGIEKSPSDKFRIVYSGSLRESQIPHKFFEALSSLNKKELIGKLELNFFGTVHPDCIKSITENNLNSIVKFHNYLPHDQVIAKMVNAEMLLLTIPNVPHNEGILTGKLFEYIGTKNFILCIGPANGDAAEIIKNLHSGETVEFNDNPEEIILKRYHQWSNNKSEKVDNNAEVFTRKNLTKKLAAIFDSQI